MIINVLNAILRDYGFNSINGAIENDENAKKYMTNVLNKYKFPTLVNDVSKMLNNMKDNRTIHTVYTFALGLYLSKFNELGCKISKLYYKRSNTFLKDVFPFVWAITSILHDIGYCQTSEIIDSVNIESVFNKSRKKVTEFIDGGCKDNIMYRLIECGCPYYCDIGGNEPGHIFSDNYEEKDDFSSHRYSKKLYINYYNYSKTFTKEKHNNEIVDHGIFGGVYAFEKLIYDNFIVSKNSNERYLVMDVAYKIIDHNIWKANADTIEDYKRNDMEELIGDNFKLIDCEEEPLLFLLCLSDTIEFTKKLGIDKDFDKWFSIDVDQTRILIQLKSTDDVIDKWIKSINTLGDWMNLTVSNEQLTTIIKGVTYE